MASLSASGFYLRHGYVDDEVSFTSFVSLFANAASLPQTERMAREHVKRALFWDEDRLQNEQMEKETDEQQRLTNHAAVDTTEGKSTEEEEEKKKNLAGCDYRRFSALTALLKAVTDDSEAAAEGQEMFEYLAALAQRQWRLIDDDGDTVVGNRSDGHHRAVVDDVVFKVSVPADRARHWRALYDDEGEDSVAVVAAVKDEGEDGDRERVGEHLTTRKEDGDDTTAVVAAAATNVNESPAAEAPLEARTTLCGVATVDPAYVTLTLACGQGLLAWLRCAALYSHNELDSLRRAAAFDVRASIEAEAAREERAIEKKLAEAREERRRQRQDLGRVASNEEEANEKEREGGNEDEAKAEKEREEEEQRLKEAEESARKERLAATWQRVDAAIAAAMANFVVPPRAPLVLTAYSKAREQRVRHTPATAMAFSSSPFSSSPPFATADEAAEDDAVGGGAASALLPSYAAPADRYIPPRRNLLSLGLAEKLFWNSATSTTEYMCGVDGAASAHYGGASRVPIPPPIVLRHSANDNMIILPSPADERVRVSWATLVQQCRYAWGVHRPVFQYVLREAPGGEAFVSLVTIADSAQFATWKRQLAAALLRTASNSAAAAREDGKEDFCPATRVAGAKALVPFELRVYENATPEDVEALEREAEGSSGGNINAEEGASVRRRRVPSPVRLSPMLNMRPPFFLPTGAVTRGLVGVTSSKPSDTCNTSTSTSPTCKKNAAAPTLLESRASALSAAQQQHSYRQLHSSLSLEAVHILSRVAAKEAHGGCGVFVSSWDKVGIDEAREQRMGRHSAAATAKGGEAVGGISSSSPLTPIPPPSRGTPPLLTGGGGGQGRGAYSTYAPASHVSYNEARGLAALHRQKLRDLEGDDNSSGNVASGNTISDVRGDEVRGGKTRTPTAAAAVGSATDQLPPINNSNNGSRGSGFPQLPLKSHNEALMKRAAGAGLAGDPFSLANLTVFDLTSPYRITTAANAALSAAQPPPQSPLTSAVVTSGSGSAPQRRGHPTMVLAEPFGPKYTVPALNGVGTASAVGSPARFSAAGGGARGGVPIDDSAYDPSSGLAAAQRHLQRLTRDAEVAAALRETAAASAARRRVQ